MLAILSSRHVERYQRLLAPYGITAGSDPATASVWLAEPIQAAKALQQGHKPKWIASVYAGVDALMTVPLPPEVKITNVREVFGPLMAQYVFAHLLSRLRHLPRYVDAQQQQQWRPTGYGSLAGQTMAIVGTGNIGSYIAKVASAFDMKVVGINTNGRDVAGFEHCFAVTELTDAVAQADVVVSILPSTSATNNLFDKTVFAQMKPTATFINVGRGNAVDVDALAAALHAEQLGHGVLDVFEQEPLPADSPLWQCPNLTITPHVAAASFPEQVVEQFAANWQRYQQGEPLHHLIDPAKGY